MIEIEAQLGKALLKASNSPIEELMQSLLNAVSSVIPCKMCSLWKLNNFAKSASIWAREHYHPTSDKYIEFVHPLEGSLIGYILQEIDLNQNSFYEINDVKEQPFLGYHKAKERTIALGLKKMVSIPIVNYEKNKEGESEIDAILNIYPDENVDFTDSIGEIIRDQFSLAISRLRLLTRELLTRELMDIYEKRGTKDLPSILYPIVNNILRKFIKYEGCSVFLWDPFLNRLNLEQTTGILTKPKKADVFYYLGEGITGTIAQLKHPILISDLDDISDEELKKEYSHKWQEDTVHPGKSFMGIPIMRPSRPDDILGVIRFTNRINMLSDVVDCFDGEDLRLIEHACILIALYMEQEQGERFRTAFAMQMAHEMLTPAVGIRGTAERLIRKWESLDFQQNKLNSYLEDILNHSNLQIALTRTIEYIWKGRSSSAKNNKYKVAKRGLFDILLSAKKLAIPYARWQGLDIDKINIVGKFPSLFIDRYAFEQIFFNLFTNSIKYRNIKVPESFLIRIMVTRSGSIDLPRHFTKSDQTRSNGFLIVIDDMGTGIEQDEKDKIFLLGYRTKGIEKTNVRGLGIGLTVVKKILEDFYCKIWISSFKNPTRFSIYIPQMLLDSNYINERDWLQ